jgi:hypothetical protein
MKISSVRLGHANNSSSTHSILLNAKGGARASSSGDFQYGWDWFHLKDRENKGKYLATLVFSALTADGMSPDHAGIVAKDLTAYDPKAGSEDGHAYVDHQSVIVLPRRLGEKHVRHDFLQEFVAYVRDNPAVSIHGGNDNEDEPVSGVLDWSPDQEGLQAVQGEGASVNQLPRDHPRLPLFGRKDRGWWILYNQETGAKIRVSFESNPAPYLSAQTPELVDIKITDFCPFGCTFCYQDSTKAGKHASIDELRTLAYLLSQAEVFEVALGGGEPTMHPEFPKILESFGGYGITPNFTTFNMAWTEKPVIVEAVKEHAHSFAVSNPAEVWKLAAWNEENHGLRGTLQIPLGCYPEALIRKALKEAHEKAIPVTLLGYKHHGRGTTFKGQDYAWIVDYMAGAQPWERFGADTVFIDQFGEDLKRRGVSGKLMVSREGAFSCYIDAVAKVMGPSSYTTDLHSMDGRNLFSKFPYAAVS